MKLLGKFLAMIIGVLGAIFLWDLVIEPILGDLNIQSASPTTMVLGIIVGIAVAIVGLLMLGLFAAMIDELRNDRFQRINRH